MTEYETTDKLYNMVSEDIRSKILRHQYGSDGRMPNFKELAVQYDVSMSTIKKAMQILSDQNLVVSRVGRGTFANTPHTGNGNGNGNRPGARTLNDQIGLLVRDIDGPYFSGIHRGLAETARTLDKRLILTVSVDDHHQEDMMYQMLIDQVEGIMITTMRKSVYGVTIFEKLLKLNLPFVFLHDVYDTPTFCFDVDNYKGGRLAARQLLERGLKKYAVIVGEIGYRVDDMRLKGFTDGLRDGGVNVDLDCFVLRCSLGSEATAFDEGYKLGMSLDIRSIGFDGILLFNDLVAMGFQKALLEKGFAIPEDIAVVGFDNIDRCSEARVPLTTISVPRREIGQAALAKLVDIIRNKTQIQPERILLEPELIVRSSA
jgi:DNA-binding LacI/PurR family transcriptional regulator